MNIMKIYRSKWVKMWLFFCFLTLFSNLNMTQVNAKAENIYSITEQNQEELVKIKNSYTSDISIGEGVMLQGFYWLCPEGDWWNTINSYIPEFSSVGFDAIWLPAPNKASSTSGVTGMGYEPYDYYDLGSFDQRGNIRTRFGTRNELDDLISQAHNNGIAMIADIVVNHNNGGDPEFNPFLATTTYTDFTNIASGLFPRNYTCFHPCEYEEADEGVFAIFPDLCHANPYVRNELINWGLWLKNDIGFDGWRFDNVVNFHASFISDWMGNVGGWGVAENWNGDRNVLHSYLDATDNSVSAFDFPLLYRLKAMSDGYGNYYMNNLRYDNGLLGTRPFQSSTFVMNHDTERDENSMIINNRHLSYAYILTHEGYPSVFWPDYFDVQYNSHIKNLVQIHNNYAKGTTTVLHGDSDLYIAQRNGDPGLIIAINDNPTEYKTASIQTKWVNTVLYDMTGHAPDIEIDSTGGTTIQVPPNDYSIYTIDDNFTYPAWVPDDSNPYVSQIIDNTSISIGDGLNGYWGFPTYFDPVYDTAGRPEDLSYLYLNHDDHYLYVGFPYRENTWTSGGNLHFGIAIDNKPGGSHWDPGVHSNISYTGNNIPDYIYYFETDVDEEPSNEIQSVTKYSYIDEKWDTGVNLEKDTEFTSSSSLKFAELKIPLEEIEFSSGGNISVKLFSSQEGKPGAADSVPQDNFTSDYGEDASWLTMPPSIEIVVSQLPDDSSKKINAYPPILLFLVFTSIPVIILIQNIKKSDKEKSLFY